MADIYVNSDTGDDKNNDGNVVRPLATLHAAMRRVSAGDDIWIIGIQPPPDVAELEVTDG